MSGDMLMKHGDSADGGRVLGLSAWRCLSRMAGAAALALACLVPFPALVSAQQATDLLRQQIVPKSTNNPLLLQADELIYDDKGNRVLARGNVEIYYNNYALTADEVIYDQGKSTLIAKGNVRIKEPNGAVVNADEITLTDDFKEGFIDSLRVVTRDDARIAAERAVRKEGNVTEFTNGVYTPCKTCPKNPEKPPLWRLRAVKVIHKQDEGNIFYEDAALEFFGVPIAYLPFFSHPDPSVKRRSGFLLPEFSYSDDLGVTATIPYYFALSPHYDFLFDPTIMSKQGFLAKGEWRHRLSNGAYNIKFAGIAQQENDEIEFLGQPLDQEFRGSLQTTGRFALSSWWNFGWDVTLESDDTFRRFYKLDSVVRTDRVSQGYLEGLNDRNYFGMYFYHFGGLLADDTSDAESQVHPVIDYNYVSDRPILGGELKFDANVLSLTRDDGSDNSHIVAEVNWRRQMIDPIGQVFTPFAGVRGDIYKVSNVDEPGSENQDYVTRALGTVGLQYQFPFVAHTSRAAHVFEPIAQVIARPDSVEQEDIPNEDANSLVFDETLLFDINKFSGYDRVETGIRANVGLQYTMQMYSGGFVRAVVGQSYQLRGENAFDNTDGLAGTTSDYVAGLYFEPNANIRLLSQSRFDEDDFQINRQDFYGRITGAAGSLSVNYALTRPDFANDLTETAQEILGSATLNLTENWSLLGAARYDLDEDLALTQSIGVRYADDCYVMVVSYNESQYEDREIDPDQSITFRFELKTLGSTQFKTDAIDNLLPNSADPEKGS